jgi:hypothetical protein
MNDVLDDRLADLFERVAAAADVDDDLERAIGGAALEQRRERGRGRGWMAVAAAAVIAAGGTAAVTQLVDRDPDTTVAEAPVDPGPLYVLPAEAAWSVSSGSTRAEAGEIDLLAGVTVGIPFDGGYFDPVAVLLTDTDPIIPADDDGLVRTTVRLPSGNADLWTSHDVIATLVQRRGNDFLSATTWDGDTQRLSRAIDAIVIQPNGALEVDPESPLAVLDRIDQPWHGIGHSTHAEVVNEHRIVVETIAAPAPVGAIDTMSFPVLAGLGSGAAEIRPIEVRGADAWLMVRYDADGTWLGLAFQLAHGTVYLSGTVPEDTLVALAEDLEVVDEATWNAATGAD